MTKGTIAEIARDANFLLAVEDYVRRTNRPALIRRGMGDPGFEPRTSALSERRSNQLS